jgi:predicted ATPase with chaperone activity
MTGIRKGIHHRQAGVHNVLMMGSPGAGKTLLARSMPLIMKKRGRIISVALFCSWVQLFLLSFLDRVNRRAQRFIRQRLGKRVSCAACSPV